MFRPFGTHQSGEEARDISTDTKVGVVLGSRGPEALAPREAGEGNTLYKGTLTHRP